MSLAAAQESEQWSWRLEAAVDQAGAVQTIDPGKTGFSWMPGDHATLSAGWDLPRSDTLVALGLQNDFGVVRPLDFLSKGGRVSAREEFLLGLSLVEETWSVKLGWAPFVTPQLGIDPTSPWFPSSSFPDLFQVAFDKPYHRNRFEAPLAATFPSLDLDSGGGAVKAEGALYLPSITWRLWGFSGQDRTTRYGYYLKNTGEPSPSSEYGGVFHVVLERWPSLIRVIGTSIQGAWGDGGWSMEGRWVGDQTNDSGQGKLAGGAGEIGYRTYPVVVNVGEAASGMTWRWPGFGLSVWGEGRFWFPFDQDVTVKIPSLGRAVAGGLSWAGDRGPWLVEAQGVWDVNDGSRSGHVRLGYRTETGDLWSIVSPWFGGRAGTLFGPYANLRMLQLQWEHQS